MVATVNNANAAKFSSFIEKASSAAPYKPRRSRSMWGHVSTESDAARVAI